MAMVALEIPMRRAIPLILPALILPAQEAPAGLDRIGRLDLEGLRQLQARLALAEAPAERRAYAEAHLAYQMAAILRDRDPKAAEALLDRTLKALQPRRDPDSLALRGACLGLKIGFQPAAAMGLSREAAGLFQEARAAAPSNPRVLLLHAVHVLHTPAFVGGGAKQALPLLEAAARAAQAEAAPSDPWAPGWGRAESLAWLALAQQETGAAAAAKRSLEAALALDPAYGFARAVVAPKVDAALAGAAPARESR